MNQHGRRFVRTRDFRSHANSLNVQFLNDAELEFYEEHCLLLPAVLFRYPAPYRIATTQQSELWPVMNPEDLIPPDALRRLQNRHVDGLDPFDAELGSNPLLVAPECSTFERWESDEKVILTAPEGYSVPISLVERYYAPWQVHIVELLRQRKYHYIHTRFLRHIDPSHELWERHRLPENTEPIRSLRGMEGGFDALERYLYADQVALDEAFADSPSGQRLSEPAQDRFRTVLARWARQSLAVSGMDEPTFFRFLSELVQLIEDYRSRERVALAGDAGEYLRDAQALARDAFQYDWDAFLAAAEDHVGSGLAAELQRLDPAEAAARAARENLRMILSHRPVDTIAAAADGVDTVPDAIVAFCLDHDLWEVLYSLQQYTYTHADARADRFPGFRNRRLRPLALAVEQLTRAILEEAADCDHPTESHSADCPHGKTLRSLVQTLGRGSNWLSEFVKTETGDRPEDESGDLEQRAVTMAAEAAAPGATRDRAIALTMAAAVATRNLISHRSTFLPTRVVLDVGGSCADAIAVVWLVARSRSLV